MEHMTGTWSANVLDKCAEEMWWRKRVFLPLTPSPRLFVTMIGRARALISSKIARTDLIRHDQIKLNARHFLRGNFLVSPTHVLSFSSSSLQLRSATPVLNICRASPSTTCASSPFPIAIFSVQHDHPTFVQ